MKKYLDILNTELKKISMRATERVEVRRAIVAYMKKHPARAHKKKAMPSPFFMNSFGVSIPSPIAALMRSTSLVSLIVIFALILGGGVSFAAESALPGDSLYTVKTNVNEPVQSFFAVSSQSQAELQVQFATRRLEEAEQLAVQGRLTNDYKQQLGQKISEHTSGFKKQFTQLVADKNYTKAVSTASEFESALSAHENVLTAIESATSTANTDATTTKSVAGEVELSLAIARDSRVIAEDKLSADTTPNIEFSAINSLASAQQMIDETKGYLDSVKLQLSTTTYSDASSTIASSQSKVVLGQSKMDTGSFGDAFILFQEARRKAEESKIYLQTSAKFASLASNNPVVATTTPAQVACATNDDCSLGAVCSNTLPAASTTLPAIDGVATTTATSTSTDLTPTAFCVLPATATSTSATTTATTSTP